MTREERAQIIELLDVETMLETLFDGELTRAYGSEVKSLCPFHDERTPSCFINTESGLFHCFGCGASGDIFDLIMKREGLQFPSAVERVAEMAGVSLSDNTVQQASPKIPEGWRKALVKASHVSEFVNARGFTIGELLENGAGYCPQQNDSYCRGRIVFPLHTPSEKPRLTATTSRAIGNVMPKWLHEPSSKTKNLMFLTEGIIDGSAKDKNIVLVEGVFDAIALSRKGFHCAAYLGSFVSEYQAKGLSNITGSVTLWPDFDDAGEAGSLSSIANLKTAGLSISVVVPDFSTRGMDPCEIAMTEDPTTHIHSAVKVFKNPGDFFNVLALSKQNRKEDDILC